MSWLSSSEPGWLKPLWPQGPYGCQFNKPKGVIKLHNDQTTRVYAITLKNVPITVCLVVLSTGQLGLGLYHTSLVIVTPSMFTPFPALGPSR